MCESGARPPRAGQVRARLARLERLVGKLRARGSSHGQVEERCFLASSQISEPNGGPAVFPTFCLTPRQRSSPCPHPALNRLLESSERRVFRSGVSWSLRKYPRGLERSCGLLFCLAPPSPPPFDRLPAASEALLACPRPVVSWLLRKCPRGSGIVACVVCGAVNWVPLDQAPGRARSFARASGRRERCALAVLLSWFSYILQGSLLDVKEYRAVLRRATSSHRIPLWPLKSRTNGGRSRARSKGAHQNSRTSVPQQVYSPSRMRCSLEEQLRSAGLPSPNRRRQGEFVPQKLGEKGVSFAESVVLKVIGEQ